MITGINKVYEHDGRTYHLQGEDLGVDLACFEVRVYDGGTVLWHKRIPYKEVLDKNLAKADQDESLRALLEKTLNTIQVGISKGKLT